MVTFTSVLLSVFAVAAASGGGVFAAPVGSLDALSKRLTLTSSSTGTQNGFYYSFWTDGGSQTMTLGDSGEYSMEWSGNEGDFVGGKGWETGSERTIAYTGTFTPHGNGYLSLYGWTKSPLTEYYILESYGTYNPGDHAIYKGTITSDGSTYKIYTDTRENKPSIEGTSSFTQYLSIRQDKRVGGTITTKNHFEAWKKFGLEIGEWGYQILAVEGNNSEGRAEVTVKEG